MKRHYFMRLVQTCQWDVHQYYPSAVFRVRLVNSTF